MSVSLLGRSTVLGTIRRFGITMFPPQGWIVMAPEWAQGEVVASAPGRPESAYAVGRAPADEERAEYHGGYRDERRSRARTGGRADDHPDHHGPHPHAYAGA